MGFNSRTNFLPADGHILFRRILLIPKQHTWLRQMSLVPDGPSGWNTDERYALMNLDDVIDADPATVSFS